MMLPHSFYKLLFTLLVSSVSAAPTLKAVERAIDTAQYCGQWDSVHVGPYSLFLDLWGMERADVGSGCASVTSLSGTTVAWTTNWNWAGSGDIKSYTNMQLNDGVNQQLSNIGSIPAKWIWSQSSSGPIIADVAYDLFTSPTSGGKHDNEIMVWLANFESGPISTSLTIDGTPIPITTNISLAGHDWDLYDKINGTNHIYSFLPSDHAPITSFEGDLYTFLEYLTSHQGVSTSQFLTTAQGGTEAVSGSATLTSSEYSMAINSKQYRSCRRT